MFRSFAPRLATLAAGAVVLAAMSTAAHASIRFTNATDNSVVFELQCEGSSTVDSWRLAPRGHTGIYCTNGADVAAIRIHTRHNDGTASQVVTGRVYDGIRYALSYDEDGDVTFTRF
jgi:opacity protein-like surface antigen